MTLEQKIQAGSTPLSGKIILHTAPHHDDILLGYFPYLLRNLAGNQHHVLYLTSGANGVSDHYLAQHQGMTLEQVAQLDLAIKFELKSAIRESESQKKWDMVGAQQVAIKNLRANFYQASHLQGYAKACPSTSNVSDEVLTKLDDFAKEGQTLPNDYARVVDYLEQIQPDIITILVDEPGCGPQTHHQAAELMFAAIAGYKKSFEQKFGTQPDLTILAYRNIWSSFTLEQASMIIPVSQQELDQIESIFAQCFLSQCNNFIMQDDGKLTNFAQQATWIIKEQGKLMNFLSAESLLKEDAAQATSIFREQGKLLGGTAGSIFMQKLWL
jgi:LmbE family N-acetylglucosaminyl deacetylase